MPASFNLQDVTEVIDNLDDSPHFVLSYMLTFSMYLQLLLPMNLLQSRSPFFS